MNNRQKLFFTLFLPFLFLITACSSQERTAPMDMNSENMATEEFVSEDEASVEDAKILI